MHDVAIVLLVFVSVIGTGIVYMLFCTNDKDYKGLQGAAQRQRTSIMTVEKMPTGTRTGKSSAASASASPPELKAILVAMKRGYYNRKLGGVIVVDKESKNGQPAMGIEYFGPSNTNTNTNINTQTSTEQQQDMDAAPLRIEFMQSNANGLRKAQEFLKDEQIEQLPLENSELYDLLRKTLLKRAKPKRNIHVNSGCIVYEGVLP